MLTIIIAISIISTLVYFIFKSKIDEYFYLNGRLSQAHIDELVKIANFDSQQILRRYKKKRQYNTNLELTGQDKEIIIQLYKTEKEKKK